MEKNSFICKNYGIAILLLLYSWSGAALASQSCTALEAQLTSTLQLLEKAQDVPSTLLLLKLIVDDAVRKGLKAPDYNLCNMRIAHTHLFCAFNKGISRVNMPQLRGFPIPFSAADSLPRNTAGEIDATDPFLEYIEHTKKYAIRTRRRMLTALKATQNEIIGSKAAGLWFALKDPTSAAYRDLTTVPLVISQDGYILDGHHRWAALVAHAISNGTLNRASIIVKEIDQPIDQLVQDANEFAQEFGIQAAAGL